MTKFEEEFKALTSWDWINIDLIQQILTRFGNWHSDEEFQYLLEQNAELTQENNLVNQINSKLDSQINDLKSQLQQQTLPVVPECVADWIEDVKEQDYNALELLYTHDMPNSVHDWLFKRDDYYNINTILRAWLDGYTVEKPQLFYLKNKITGMYLSSDGKELYEHHKNHGFKFTQQEIESMDTGSYELVPVEDGE